MKRVFSHNLLDRMDSIDRMHDDCLVEDALLKQDQHWPFRGRRRHGRHGEVRDSGGPALRIPVIRIELTDVRRCSLYFLVFSL